MLLFVVILWVFCTIIGAVFFRMELSIENDRLRWLEERLTKLEKDAVKITFNEPSPFHRKPKTQTDYENEHKKSNPKQFDGFKSEEPFVKTRTKRKPTTVSDWEDKFDLGGNQ
jgi:hypothetical protein